MAGSIIEVKNISKRFILNHEGGERYTALRDVVAQKLKKTFSFPASLRGTKETKEEFWALKDVSFNVEQGDRVGIIGRNGAGKSTLLKILSRITEPTSGEIRIKGRVASLLEVGTGFHPELTGRENIFLNGAILGMSRAEIKRKFDEIVDFAEVEKFLDTPVKRYSSGMYVRLAFAVAAHLEPEILVVDEVLAVGDAEFQKKCLGKMQDVSNSEGRTVLFVSHQLGMVKALCNKGALLNKGKLEFQGNIGDTIDNYLDNSKLIDTNCNVTIPLNENLSAQIINIKLLNKNGDFQSEFDVFEQKFLEVDLIVRKDKLGFHIGYVIERNGDILVCSAENDFDSNRLDPRAKGEYKLRVELPTPLKAGTYTMSQLAIGQPNIGNIHKVENPIQFEVEELSFDPSMVAFSKNRAGIMVVSYPWDIIDLGTNSDIGI